MASDKQQAGTEDRELELQIGCELAYSSQHGRGEDTGVTFTAANADWSAVGPFDHREISIKAVTARDYTTSLRALKAAIDAMKDVLCDGRQGGQA